MALPRWEAVGGPDEAAAPGRGLSSPRPAVDAVADSLATVAGTEPHVHALLHVDHAGAMAAARRVDRRTALGREPGRLAGVPLVVKDNVAVRGMPLTCGSAATPRHAVTRDARLVTRLRRAGAIVVGKANLDEFGMGATTESSAFGPTRNPYDLTRTAGGSSGGSAAAVAAGQVPMAVGTDTGGSIREPAAQCGVVGVKPSYGAVPTQGVVPFSSSLDQAGPLARSVLDAARLHEVLAGTPGLAAAAVTGAVDRDLRGQRVGLVTQLCGPTNAAGVRRRLEAVLTLLTALGAEVVDVSLPSASEALTAYYAISSYEAVPMLERYQQGLGPEAAHRFRTGAGLRDDPTRSDLRWASEVAGALRQEVAAGLARCGTLVSPTMPVTAPLLGRGSDDPLAAPRTDCWTVLANLTGIPALSLPAGDCPDTGLPVGVQLMAPHGRDARLYRLAAALQPAVN